MTSSLAQRNFDIPDPVSYEKTQERMFLRLAG